MQTSAPCLVNAWPLVVVHAMQKVFIFFKSFKYSTNVFFVIQFSRRCTTGKKYVEIQSQTRCNTLCCCHRSSCDREPHKLFLFCELYSSQMRVDTNVHTGRTYCAVTLATRFSPRAAQQQWQVSPAPLPPRLPSFPVSPH